jgi:putative addiction module killer protein
MPQKKKSRNMAPPCRPPGLWPRLTKVTYVLPQDGAEVREDLDRNGRSPYAEWFDRPNAQAAAKVAIAVTRIGQGNFSKVRSVGSGVHECKIKFGPGYRVYFGENGESCESLVISLGGRTKKRQQRDINDAIATWQDYKIRKK